MRPIEQLQYSLQAPLPGLSAQLRMAPPYRDVPDEAFVRAQNPKPAAVLLLLAPGPSDWQVVLTRRQPYPGVHSAQISFPGGKVEPTDRNKYDTALRETEEEIGIPAAKIELLGDLSPLYIPPSNYLVDPVVGCLHQPLPYQAQASEVAEILEIPLSWFYQPQAQSQRAMPHIAGNPEVPGFLYQSHFIWGATAMMLAEFLAVAAGWQSE